jgi:putative ABC transport system permease protein
VLREAVDRLEALPGVARVAVAIRAPLSQSGGGMAQPVTVSAGPAPSSARPVEVKYGVVSGAYFQTMGIALVKGRGFSDDEPAGERVMVVSEQFAARFFDARDAVGGLVRVGGRTGTDHRIIGIVRDAPINRVDEPREPYFYLPFWAGQGGEVTFLVAAARDAATLAPIVRDALVATDPRLDPRRLVTMDEYVRYTARDYETSALLGAALGGVGLLLTALGVYGVMTYRAAGRTREIGIRLALGADRRTVLAMVLQDGGRIALTGLAIGVPASIVSGRMIRALLFGVGPGDVLAIVVAVLLVAVTVLIATIPPAVRAMRIDPTVALRDVG